MYYVMRAKNMCHSHNKVSNNQSGTAMADANHSKYPLSVCPSVCPYACLSPTVLQARDHFGTTRIGTTIFKPVTRSPIYKMFKASNLVELYPLITRTVFCNNSACITLLTSVIPVYNRFWCISFRLLSFFYFLLFEGRT